METPQHDFWGTISAIALAIVGVASLAVILSRNSTTTQVISASGSAFSGGLATALTPITGSGSSYGVNAGISMYPIA